MSNLRFQIEDFRLKISGKVIYGDHYGKTLGFPTANIDRRNFKRRKLKIKFGVWAGWTQVGLRKYKSGIVIGPLDKSGLPKIEAHLIGFKGNLYGKKLVIGLKKYIRPFRKFTSGQELKKQISADLIKIIKILS